jgi:hypothetical protein
MLTEEFVPHPPRIHFWLKADFILIDTFAWLLAKSYIIGSSWNPANQAQQNVKQKAGGGNSAIITAN